MSTQTLETLVVVLDGKVDRLLQELRRGDGGVRSFVGNTDKSFLKLENRFTSVAGKLRGLFGLFGVSFGVRAFAGWIESATELDKLTSSEAEKLKGFKTAMNELNSSTDELAQTVAIKLAPALEKAAKFWNQILDPGERRGAFVNTKLSLLNSALEQKVEELKNFQLGKSGGMNEEIELRQKIEQILKEISATTGEPAPGSKEATIAQEKWDKFLADLEVSTGGARQSSGDLIGDRARQLREAGLNTFDAAGAKREIDQRFLREINPQDFITKLPDDWQRFDVAGAQRDIDERTESLKKMNDALEKSKRSAAQFADTFSAAFESRGIDALVDGDISGAIRGLVRDFAEMIIRLTVLRPLAESVANALSGIGKDGNPTGAGAFASLFGFAAGGRPPMGRASIVGEAGPELFIPDVGGRILSNAQSRAALAGAGGGLTVVQHFHNQYGNGPAYYADLVETGKAAAKAAYDAAMKTLGGRR